MQCRFDNKKPFPFFATYSVLVHKKLRWQSLQECSWLVNSNYAHYSVHVRKCSCICVCRDLFIFVCVQLRRCWKRCDVESSVYVYRIYLMRKCGCGRLMIRCLDACLGVYTYKCTCWESVDVESHILLLCVSHIQQICSNGPFGCISAEVQHHHSKHGQHDAYRLPVGHVSNSQTWHTAHTETDHETQSTHENKPYQN